jgi:hypothetical protein
MSQDLYASPPGGGVNYGAISEKVKMPAIFMMVVAGLTIVWNLLMVVLNIAGVSMSGLAPGGGEQERIAQMFSGGIGIVFALLGIVVNAIIIFGALKMKSLAGYALAMTAAILAIVPCSCCCILNTPFGIWSLVVLLDQNVKAAFRS